MNTGPCRWDGMKQRASNGPTAPTGSVNAGLIYSLRLARSAPKMPFWPPSCPVSPSLFLVIREKICFASALRTELPLAYLLLSGALEKSASGPEFQSSLPVVAGSLSTVHKLHSPTWPCSRSQLLWGAILKVAQFWCTRFLLQLGFFGFQQSRPVFQPCRPLITWREAEVNPVHPGKLGWGQKRGRSVRV